MYNFDEPIDRHGTGASKWDAGPLMLRYGFCDHYDANTIPLFTADMDFSAPDSVRESIMKRARHNIYGYLAHAPEVDPAWYEAVCRWYRKRQNWEIEPHTISYANGTIEALKAAFRAFSNAGDSILINRPIYGPFTINIEKVGRKVCNSQLIADENLHYTINWADFEKKCAEPDVKIFILCHPHNPTGRIWTDEELVRMYEICTANDVLVISDEIHGDLIRSDQEFHPLATLVDGKNLITFNGVNKTFNLAGLQGTNAIITNPELKAAFDQAIDYISPNPLTLAAMQGAYEGGEEWLDELKVYLDGNIDWVLNFLHEHMPKVHAARPEGTYILWLDFRDYGISPEEIHRRIYFDADVLLEGGKMFDPDYGAGFERMCLSTRRALIQEAWQRIEKAFADLS